MKFDVKSKKEFIQFYRQKQRVDNTIIDELEHNYGMHTPIWWYTRDCCLSDIINQAFRLQNFYTIIKMRFFIQDLHEQIEKLYKTPSEKLTLYRGQGLTPAHFEQLRTMQGGLFSFNSFLSASVDENVALFYADHSRHDSDLIGIVFQINIDPTTRISTTYASLDNENYHSDAKQEFLFAIHTIFRVGEMKQLDEQLWKIELSLTSNDDKDIRHINEYIRPGTQGSTGWDRLDYSTIHNDMGSLYQYTGEYAKALESYEMALNIEKKSNPVNCSNLAIIYDNIAVVNKTMKQYSAALQYYQIISKIHKACIPLNFQKLSATYKNIAEIHYSMDEYPQALKAFQKILNIQRNYLSQNYIDMADIESNISQVYESMGEHSKASEHYESALKYCQMLLESHKGDVANLAIIYNSIASIYKNKKDYFKAIEFYRKTIEILKKFPHVTRPDLAVTCDNIGQMYESIHDSKTALFAYKHAMQIEQQASPPNPTQLQLYQKHYHDGLTKGNDTFTMSVPASAKLFFF
ncbi:unnamed protein product [Rotaria sordida]|uniref:Uncharacterized protein n=1 Tax=Rotaria sordida TaxID=392033 RepID=A0A814MLD0_9BILA|nr:unnamed protein product [Rotaria sordida]